MKTILPPRNWKTRQLAALALGTVFGVATAPGANAYGPIPPAAQVAAARAKLKAALAKVRPEGPAAVHAFIQEHFQHFWRGKGTRPERYAGLVMVIDFDARHGHAHQAFFAQSILRAEFIVHTYAMDLAISRRLALWKPKTAKQATSVIDTIEAYTQSAISRWRLRTAQQMVAVVRGPAHHAGAAEVQQLHQLVKRIAERWHARRYQNFQRAQAILKKDPHNGAASLTAGLFLRYCAYKQRRGAALLAQCSDSVLRTIGRMLGKSPEAWGWGDLAYRLRLVKYYRQALKTPRDRWVQLALIQQLQYYATVFTPLNVENAVTRAIQAKNIPQARRLLRGAIAATEATSRMAVMPMMPIWRKTLADLQKNNATTARHEIVTIGGPLAHQFQHYQPFFFPSPVRVLTGCTREISALAISNKRGLVAAGTVAGQVLVWSAKSGKLRYHLNGQKHQVLTLAFSRNGLLLAATGQGLHTYVWNTKTGALQDLLQTPAPSNAALFLPDNKRLLLGASNGLVTIWNARTGASLGQIPLPNQMEPCVFSMTMGPRGRHFYVGSCSTVHRASVRRLQFGRLQAYTRRPVLELRVLRTRPRQLALMTGLGTMRLYSWKTPFARVRKSLGGAIPPNFATGPGGWIYFPTGSNVVALNPRTLQLEPVYFSALGWGPQITHVAATQRGNLLAAAAGNQNSPRFVVLWHLPPNWKPRQVKSEAELAKAAYRRAISGGDLQAAYALAWLDVRLHDYPAAARWAKVALGAYGRENLYTLMGELYVHGWGVRKNFARAFHWFRWAAITGNKFFASTDLGRCYYHGWGVKKDVARALAMWSATPPVSAKATYVLARALLTGHGIKANRNRGAAELVSAARSGYLPATMMLARMEWRGRLAAHPKLYLASKYFAQAAEAGNALAADDLARVLLQRRKKAVAAGNLFASHWMLQKAVVWLRRSARRGNADAARRLAACYATGRGVPKNKRLSTVWKRAAARDRPAPPQPPLLP